MAEGNPKSYEWNSHTSIAHFYGVDEDKWNKWEYNKDKKELVLDIGKEDVIFGIKSSCFAWSTCGTNEKEKIEVIRSLSEIK